MPLPVDFRDEIIRKLRERGARAQCEVCGHNNWAVADKAAAIQLTDLSDSFKIPSPQIPAAAVICNNCGNVRLFALGALGFPLNKKERPKEEKKK